MLYICVEMAYRQWWCVVLLMCPNWEGDSVCACMMQKLITLMPTTTKKTKRLFLSLSSSSYARVKKFNVSHKDKFASVFTMRKYVTKGVVTPMMIIISSTSSSSSVSKVKDKRKEVIAENSSSSFLDNETAADDLDRNVYVIQKGSRPTQQSFLCYRTLYFFKFSCAWRNLTEKRW